MKQQGQKTAHLKVSYSKPQPAQPIIDHLLRSGLRSVTLLRGRMTARDAWYELEITGAARTIRTVSPLETA